jgi:hypothetical protein
MYTILLNVLITDIAVDESRDFAIAGEMVNIAIQGMDPIALRYAYSLVLILTAGSATWCVIRTIRSLSRRVLRLGSLPLKRPVQ